MNRARKLREQERERQAERLRRLLEDENKKVDEYMKVLSRATTFEDQARLAAVAIEQSKFHTETLIDELRRLDDDRKTERLEDIARNTARATWAAAFVGLAAVIVALAGYFHGSAR